MKPKPQPKGARQPDAFSYLTFILIGLAVVSVIALDRINWKKGEPSYIFLPLSKTKAAEVQVKADERPAARVPPAEEKPQEKPESAKKAPIKKEPAAEEKTAPAVPEARSQVALIIDDMGNSLEVLQELINLERPLTVAVLPTSAFAKETAQTAHENGLEVILHLPLESLNNHEPSGSMDGIVHTGMNEEEVTALIEQGFNQVPHIMGVNNHMGSKATADKGLMKIVLAAIRQRNLFFIDSRTGANSVAYEEAINMGIPAAQRQVFLDAEGDTKSPKERLQELFQSARRNGRAVGIGHPFAETIQALKEGLPFLDQYNLEAVFASQIVRR
jgi:hypothetical protein